MVGRAGLCGSAAVGRWCPGGKKSVCCPCWTYRWSGARTPALALVGAFLADEALSSGADAVHLRPRLGNLYPAAWAPAGYRYGRTVAALVGPQPEQGFDLHLGRPTS